MAKIIQVFQTIRNHWKKSTVAVAVVSYGVSRGKEEYDSRQLMRQYCKQAMKYGDTPLPTSMKVRHVTVILNPRARNGKAAKLFEKYCEPLLHLAGIEVNVIRIGSGDNARSLVMNLDTSTDAIVVAGGDETLADVITGLVRKCNANLSQVRHCPIGILPLGEANTIAKSLYHNYDDLKTVRELIEATMTIISEKHKMMDVVEIIPLEEDPEEPVKPLYAMGTIKWGAWRDTHVAINKYWYWGSLKKYAAYVFNGYKSKLSWNCDAVLKYTEPCSGCSSCYEKEYSFVESSNTNKRWWHAFMPRRQMHPSENNIDYSTVTNEKCNILREVPISTTELHITTSNINKSQDIPQSSLQVQIGPKNIDYVSFVTEGWKQESNDTLLMEQAFKAKNIEIIPQTISEDQEFSIDSETYELKPIRIRLIPHAVKMYCPEPGS